MADRNPAPPKIRKLTVIVPVFNERNTVVEVVRPDDASELERWNRQGFVGASPLLERQIAVAAARR